jgi:predicted N-formylglutamate amidohydrolase
MRKNPHPDETPFETVDGPADCGLLILCDHASNALPAAYGSLGLPASEFERHIGYDIGGRAITLALAEMLGVPAVLSTFSRLLVDPNRGEDDPTVMMRLSDGTVVPGNHKADTAEIEHRLATYHRPYHRQIETQIDTMMASGTPPLIFSIHSFTPVWRGVPRPWEAAVLWDNDPRANIALRDMLAADRSLTIGDNEPYNGCLTGDTIYRHATMRGLANCLIELRQNEIADDAGVQIWADRLAPLLEDIVARPEMHEIAYYGSRADGTARAQDNPERPA